MKFAVIIPTYNPDRTVLRRVCQAIAAQSHPASLFRLIVVDNASQPPLTPDDFTGIPLTVTLLAEPRPGTTYARLTGLAAAGDDHVVFVDDDNVLHPDYLRNAAAFLNAHPDVGALGGIVAPEFPVKPEPGCEPHLHMLALRNLGPDPIIESWTAGAPRHYPWSAPFGAGMVLRSSCVRRYLDYVVSASSITIGRTGTKALGGCEDCELLVTGVLAGGEKTAYSPDLRLDHVIAPRRLTRAYFRKLAYECGVSWGAFCVKNGFLAPIPRWTLPFRIARSYLRERAWTRAGRIAWLSETGRYIGRARLPQP